MVDIFQKLEVSKKKLVFKHKEVQESFYGYGEDPEDDDEDELLEELVNGRISEEILLDECKYMFSLARYRLQGILQSNQVLDANQDLDIKCREYTEKMDIEVVAHDLIALVFYLLGFVNIFPKALVCSSSIMMHLVPSGTKGETREGDKAEINKKETSERGIPTADRSQLDRLYMLVAELQENMLKHMKDKEDMINRIINLEKQVVTMSQQSSEKTEWRCHHLQECTTESKSPNVQVNNGDQSKDGVKHTPEKDDMYQGRARIEGRNTTVSPNVGSHSAIEDIPNIDKNEDKARQTSKQRHKEANNINKTQDEEEQKSQSFKESKTMKGDPIDVAKVEQGEKSDQVFEFQRRRKHKSNKVIVKDIHQNNVGLRKPIMQGAKPVKTVPLYVKNILLSGDESDSEIEAMVTNYAKSKDIRVNKCYIVKYKGCDTVVGCKLVVQEDFVEVALGKEIWPEHVQCRIWERPDVWRKIRKMGEYTRNR